MKEKDSKILSRFNSIIEKQEKINKELQILLSDLLHERQPVKEVRPTALNDYVDKNEFLKIFKISNSTFCKWIREGKMKVIRLGKGITYIHKSELEKLLKNAA